MKHHLEKLRKNILNLPKKHSERAERQKKNTRGWQKSIHCSIKLRNGNDKKRKTIKSENTISPVMS
jgi:hypothetical protein